MIKEGVMIGGRYEIMGRIGMGGMADVYKAVDTVLNRYVAVKVLKREFREDENFVKKFRSEAQAAAGLLHPNIVNVYDVAEDRGLYYIVMELVEGITLKDYIQKKGQLSPKEVVGITVQVCSAIDMAHSHNIVHRDIKPQNIIISKEGKVKVTDFGIAKATSSNTISTNAMGSVHYTSPEQARGGFSDAKSDIYSLGITMYEMITGRLPFDGDSTVAIALKHLQEDMVLPSEYVPDIPYSLENIILKCTQKSPDRRYAEVGPLIRDLKRSLAEPDGDFVKIAPFVSAADTVMITPEELQVIQGKSNYNVDYDDDNYDDNYDDEYDEERRPRKRSSSSKKSEIDPKMAKIMKIMTIVVAVIFVFILIFAISSATGLIKFGPDITEGSEEDKIKVPELEGKTEEEAQEACEKAGLQMKVVSRKESKKHEEGLIDSQKTQAGTEMPEGAIVQVVVSTGKLLEIPELGKKNYIDARDILIELGFDKDNIKMVEEPHKDIEEDKVIRTEPAAGEWKTKSTVVTVYVSTGIEMVEVPNLAGKTKDEAEKALTDAGLVGSATEEYDATVEAGKVISQKTDAGDEVEAGSTVEYVVSKGEEPKEMVKVPSADKLIGKKISEVQKELDKVGLKADVRFATYPGYESGTVAEVENAGKEVEKGASIKVYVSDWTPAGTEEEPEAGTETE
ncbi:MAG: Stk1 family PASTA domain-containing Ser/Thr kinase [Tyzzerella sp.]|nr:Stk1 family PASTA domain-containing Ser/Thr kinase [Tyzzerella sp.]